MARRGSKKKQARPPPLESPPSSPNLPPSLPPILEDVASPPSIPSTPLNFGRPLDSLPSTPTPAARPVAVEPGSRARRQRPEYLEWIDDALHETTDEEHVPSHATPRSARRGSGRGRGGSGRASARGGNGRSRGTPSRSTRGTPYRRRTLARATESDRAQHGYVDPILAARDDRRRIERHRRNDAEERLAQSLLSSNAGTRAATSEAQAVAPRSGSIAPSETSTTARVRKRTSDVWQFFKKEVVLGELEQQHVCQLCPLEDQSYYSLTTTTTGLRGHLTTYHSDVYAESKGTRRPKNDATIPEFSNKELTNFMVRFIVANSLSLRISEYPELRALMRLLRQDLADRDIPHKDKIRANILRQWRDLYHRLSARLQASPGKISLTFDMWTTQKMFPFLAITAHYMQEVPTSTGQPRYRMESDCIAFRGMPGTHYGRDLAEVIVDVLRQLGILNKIMCIITDGEAKNDATVQDFAHALRHDGFEFPWRERKLTCVPHTLHLAMGDISAKIRSVSTVAPGFPTAQPSPDAAILRDPIALFRIIVNYIKKSSQRRTALMEIVLFNNRTQGWGLVFCELTGDCTTRWTSTHVMLVSVRHLRKPLEAYFNRALVAAEFEDVPTSCEWVILDDLITVYQPAAAVQEILASEKTPTLAHAIPTLYALLSLWDEVLRQCPHLFAIIEAGRHRINTYLAEIKTSRPHLISMVLHPHFRLQWIQDHFTSEEQDFAERVIRSEMLAYRPTPTAPPAAVSMSNASSSRMSNAPSATTAHGLWVLYQDAQSSSRHPPRARTTNDEWESYKNRTDANSQPGITVDIVEWWNDYGALFPTLHKIALDYLPAQASSVPSERVFSSAGETDTKRRNRIHPQLFEALQMLKYDFRKDCISFVDVWVPPVVVGADLGSLVEDGEGGLNVADFVTQLDSDDEAEDQVAM